MQEKMTNYRGVLWYPQMNNSLLFSSIQRPTRFHTSVKNRTSLIHTTAKIATASGKRRRLVWPNKAHRSLLPPWVNFAADLLIHKFGATTASAPSRRHARILRQDLYLLRQFLSPSTHLVPPVAYGLVPNRRSQGAALLAGQVGGARHAVLGARPGTEFLGIPV
jgi:hypothetical protein